MPPGPPLGAAAASAARGAAIVEDDYGDDVSDEDIETIDMEVDSPLSNNDIGGIVENYASPPENRSTSSDASCLCLQLWFLVPY